MLNENLLKNEKSNTIKQISKNSKNEINHQINFNTSSSILFITSLETSTLSGTNPTDSLKINENKKTASLDLVEKKLQSKFNHDGSNLNKLRDHVTNDEQNRIREEKFTEVIDIFT